jgi:hypothetical protein
MAATIEKMDEGFFSGDSQDSESENNDNGDILPGVQYGFGEFEDWSEEENIIQTNGSQQLSDTSSSSEEERCREKFNQVKQNFPPREFGQSICNCNECNIPTYCKHNFSNADITYSFEDNNLMDEQMKKTQELRQQLDAAHKEFKNRPNDVTRRALTKRNEEYLQSVASTQDTFKLRSKVKRGAGVIVVKMDTGKLKIPYDDHETAMRDYTKLDIKQRTSFRHFVSIVTEMNWTYMEYLLSSYDRQQPIVKLKLYK